MKRGVSLYIAGQKVDIEEKSLILFNYALTDMTNPTVVKNSYSKEITLEGTPTNNKIFGTIFRNDRRTQVSTTYVGINFDPLRKVSFEIYDEIGAMLESGYVKLNSISRDGESVSYNITLYGGLGSFLYGLSYNEDGSKKTLADLLFYNNNGNVVDFAMSDCVNNGASLVSEAWDYLEKGTLSVQSWWHIVNFAPMYNGLPKGFDTKKALVIPSNLANANDAPTGYGVKGDAGGYAMVIMTNDHTESEMNDYRWYLQRPVINLLEIIKAISNSENNGGYSVDISSLPSFVANESVWMTLNLISEDDRKNDECIKNVLKATPSPADILLSWVKMYGLVMRCDSFRKKIEIMPRDTYYGRGYDKGVIDLSYRVDKNKEINIVPTTIDSSRYKFGGNITGAAAQEYLEEYGVEYGTAIINTSWEFDNKTQVLTDSIIFRGAVDYCAKGDNFKRIKKSVQGLNPSDLFPFPLNEDVNIQLWSNDAAKNFKMYAQIDPLDTTTFFNEAFPGYDKFNKLQLHNADLSDVEGSNVLVYFNGMSSSSIVVSNDVAAFDVLNDGKPCWLYNKLSNSGKSHSAPLFGRGKVVLKMVTNMLEWGIPKKRYTVGLPVSPLHKSAAYSQAWQSYMEDRYNGNTRMMSCRVNLRGLPIGADLMNRFFWYENSIWVLERLNNYSLTTFDDAECEFVQVMNYVNYTGGQYK